jgi:predicted DCC family thiol-disulfide oxidoreductase YuxK
MVSSHTNIGARLLVVFDGHCVLCNHAVRWLLRRDRCDRLRFAAFSSPTIAPLLARQQGVAPNAGPGSILVVRDADGPAEQLLLRSTAVLALFAELPRPWPAIASALRWIPRPVRDLAYRFVARCRYRIWGRLTSCPIPTSEEQGRYL